MDILAKMEEVKKRFDEVQKVINVKQQEMITLIDEQKRMQGEYRLLAQLGIEQGVLDQNGNPIQNKDEEK